MKNKACILLMGMLLFVFTTATTLKAQKKVPLINSGDLLTQGMSLADSGQYDKASDLYEQISRNDTNYEWSLSQDAISRISGGEDSLAIGICRKGIALHTEYDPDFYKLLASAYIDLDKNNEAIKLLKDTAIVKYPNVFLLYYSLGLAYYKAHQYDSAIASFEKSIRLNIFHASSHYYLGKCCIEQGRLIPGMLSLQFYLLIDPNSQRSFSTIQLMEEASEGKYDYNKAYLVDPSKYHDEAFSDLDLIIKSKVALNDDYKAKTKISYGVIKQCQLLMEKLSYTPNTNNFWMEEYVPFFTALQQKGYFEPYAYYIMSSVPNDDLQKDIAKEKRKIDAFASWAGETIAKDFTKRDETINGVKKTITYLYYDNHMLKAKGEEDAKGVSIGEWTIYNQYNGTVAAKGLFNDQGNREGQWVWYYYNGTMKERTNFKNDKREGLSETWYENGAKKAKYNFGDDKLNGEAWEYTSSGTPSTYGTYKNDKPTGPFTVYYADGKTHYIVNYADGNFDGLQKEYYVTGQLSLTSNYANAKKNGRLTDYWPNGKMQDSGEYKDDNMYGTWRYFYRDGSLQKEGTYNDDGKPVDTWTLYYRNGKKSEEMTYNKEGQLNGPDIMYDDDGIKYGTLDYKDDELQHIAYYDKTGKTIYEGKESDGKMEHENFYPNGVKLNEGESLNGKRTGAWKFYASTGELTDIENYQDGKLQGIHTEYYLSGIVKDSLNYTNDLTNGVYHSYFENGQLKSIGWYVNGSKQGDWYYYNARGTLITHRYYLNDNTYGYADFYDANGNLATEEYTNPLGYFDKAWLYDTTGKKIIYSYISDNGNGAYKPTYSNGQVKIDRTYMAGSTEGHQKTYFFNGNLWSEGDFLLGNRQGKYTVYYENGKPQSVFNYDQGNVEGHALSYFSNGKIRMDDNYLNDNEDGPFKQYFENGRLQCEGHDTDGQEEGELDSYFEDSSFYCAAWYHNGTITSYSYPGKDGKLVPAILIKNGAGNMVCYFANGKKALDCTYTHGYIDGKRTYYTPEGKVYTEENFVNGNMEGAQKYYFRDGKLKSEQNYYLGSKDGVSRYYYENGKLEHEEQWVLGDRQGTFKYYDKTGKLIKTAVYYNDDMLSESKAK